MIRLFTANETNFDHNGMVLTDAKITITEDVDGIFDLDLEYPLNDRKGLSGFIIKGNIIKSNIYEWDTRGEQLFEIRKVNYTVKKGEKKVIAYAQAIGRSRLGKNFVLGCRTPAGSTRKVALQTILSKCVDAHTFVVGNLDTNTNTNINLGLDETTGVVINYLDTDYMSPLKAFLGESKSVQVAYGGEIIYNNFEINMVDERGSDHSFIIKSGKNLQELQQEISDLDNENFATALIMKSSDGLYLPNDEIIYSSNVASLGKYYKVITCDDVQAVDDTQAAINIVYAQLRDRATKQFTNGIDKLPINNTINFLQLANTEEYKNYASLEKCNIGNNVTVNYEKASIEATGRVTQIKFNPIANNGKGKIIEVTIGDRKKKSIVDTITTAASNVVTVNDKTNKNTDKIKKARKEAKDYTDITHDNLVRFIGETETGIMIEVRAADSALGSRIDFTETEISARVKSSEFGSLIEQHADSIVSVIEGITNNKTTLNSSGFHVSGGAFDFSGYNGEKLINAVADGSITAIRIGDDDWNIETSMEKVLIGGSPFGQYLRANNIIDFELKVETVLRNYNLIP